MMKNISKRQKGMQKLHSMQVHVVRRRFCRLLIIFANSSEQGQNVSPDLDPNCFTPRRLILKEIFE